MGVGGQRHTSAALSPGKTQYPLYRRLGGPQGQSHRCVKSRPYQYSIPGPSSPQRVAIPTELSRPTKRIKYTIHFFLSSIYVGIGESNGKLPLRTCPGCSVPEPYRSPDWALVPGKPAEELNTHYYYYYYYYCTFFFFFFFFLGPVCISSGSTAAFKVYCAYPKLLTAQIHYPCGSYKETMVPK
jgi:hypothetical protein